MREDDEIGIAFGDTSQAGHDTRLRVRLAFLPWRKLAQAIAHAELHGKTPSDHGCELLAELAGAAHYRFDIPQVGVLKKLDQPLYRPDFWRKVSSKASRRKRENVCVQGRHLQTRSKAPPV
jgi:hypothetical protein